MSASGASMLGHTSRASPSRVSTGSRSPRSRSPSPSRAPTRTSGGSPSHHSHVTRATYGANWNVAERMYAEGGVKSMTMREGDQAALLASVAKHFEALKQIWRKLYGASEYGPEDEHFVFRDGDEDEKQSMEDNEPTLAQELATKILNAIDSEKTSLSSGTYVKLCDALREVHNLPVKRKPKSLFDGVVFGPNRLEFDEWLYEEYR